MTAQIDKAIKLLEEVEQVQAIQRDRGWNTIRAEMIERMLFDVQQEVVHALRENASKKVG
jgi:hypothetical protein